MKASSYGIVSLTYMAVALVLCLAQRAIHFEHTMLALLLAAITSISVGAFLWHRDSPTTSMSHVSFVLGSVIMLLGVACILVLHALFGWFENLQVDVPITAGGNFIGTFILLPTFWRKLIEKPGETADEDVSADK